MVSPEVLLGGLLEGLNQKAFFVPQLYVNVMFTEWKLVDKKTLCSWCLTLSGLL